MTFSTSDLTPLLQAAPTAQMRYASGVIKSWNSESFENVIEVRGSELINLPVLSGPDALTYKAGDVVSLIGADQQGARGIASYAILGRFVVPGQGKAQEAIEWMTSELGRAIAASVFADRVKNDSNNVQSTNPNEAVWEDSEIFSGVDPGPTVEMEITERGAALVIMTARIGGQDGAHGMMGIEVSGATELPVNVSFTAQFQNSDAPPDHSMSTNTAVLFLEDLNPGVHTFQAKYWSLFAANGSKPGFAGRNVTVIGF